MSWRRRDYVKEEYDEAPGTLHRVKLTGFQEEGRDAGGPGRVRSHETGKPCGLGVSYCVCSGIREISAQACPGKALPRVNLWKVRLG
jgi:hypothetical protein